MTASMRVILRVLLTVCVVCWMGCGGDGDSEGAKTGTVGGECYPNGTCDAGLECVQGYCVPEAPVPDTSPPEDTAPPPEDTAPPPEDTAPPPEDTAPPEAVCGNNKKEGSEECDDGNIADGDGCSATCQTVCDHDKDEFEAIECGGTDCDDTDSSVYPLAGDSYGDGVDSDCDGMDCAAGPHGSSYFSICIPPSQWANAETQCAQGGYAFGSIRSDSENQFVEELFEPFNASQLWIGFSDGANEGDWVWADGYTGSYTNWYGINPNDGGSGQDCAVLENSASHQGQWDDGDCNTVLPVLCRYNAPG